MTEAATILKMIETVDPSDTAKLDEIDARVWCYINFETLWTFGSINGFHDGVRTVYFYVESKNGGKKATSKKYTRSRDALKAIRPRGVYPCVKIDELGFTVWAYHKDKLYFPTEELAELHAIIQAIENERSNK